jgi:hypothetical protein
METKKQLSLECKNRISLWMLMLEKTCSYLVIWENIWNNASNYSHELDGLYYAGRPHRFKSEFAIEQGLLEAAVIWFCNIFGNGKSGTGISDNYADDVKNVRKEMMEYTSQKLGYSNVEDFKSFVDKVKEVRHQLIAHYDGSKADYKLPDLNLVDQEGNIVEVTAQDSSRPAMQEMKAPCVNLEFEEKKKIKESAICMLEYLYTI